MEIYRPTCHDGKWVVVDLNGNVVEECDGQIDSVFKANSLNGY